MIRNRSSYSMDLLVWACMECEQVSLTGRCHSQGTTIGFSSGTDIDVLKLRGPRAVRLGASREA